MGCIAGIVIMREIDELEVKLSTVRALITLGGTTEELIIKQSVLKSEINDLRWEAWEEYR